MSRTPRDRFAVRILDQLVRLRAVGALPLTETAPASGVWRYRFRAAGQPVSIDLDTTVVEMRCYHDRDEIAMGPLSAELLDMLLGKRPTPPDAAGTAEAEVLAEMRRIVADWREGNPRIYMRPPAKVGHPDNWNGA
jgi:hypothetical protein